MFLAQRTASIAVSAKNAVLLVRYRLTRKIVPGQSTILNAFNATLAYVNALKDVFRWMLFWYTQALAKKEAEKAARIKAAKEAKAAKAAAAKGPNA